MRNQGDPTVGVYRPDLRTLLDEAPHFLRSRMHISSTRIASFTETWPRKMFWWEEVEQSSWITLAQPESTATRWLYKLSWHYTLVPGHWSFELAVSLQPLAEMQLLALDGQNALDWLDIIQDPKRLCASKAAPVSNAVWQGSWSGPVSSNGKVKKGTWDSMFLPTWESRERESQPGELRWGNGKDCLRILRMPGIFCL